jgi:hypothetical protein
MELKLKKVDLKQKCNFQRYDEKCSVFAQADSF